MQEIKLDIIHEEKHQDYWDLKAHKGGKGRIVVGNIRDVEVMINGTTVTGHDLVLRTGAWGKDIIVPTAIATVATAGIADCSR